MGGYSGFGNRLKSAEIYDVDRNQWSLLPPMNKTRSDAGCCSSGGKIFVAGGFTGDEILYSAEMFDPMVGLFEILMKLMSIKYIHYI